MSAEITATDAAESTAAESKEDSRRQTGMATTLSSLHYEYYEDNKVTGIDMDIMQAIADELGMDMQVEDMQFDAIIAAVSSGKVDVGAAGFTVTEDRQKNVDFTDTYITTKQEYYRKRQPVGFFNRYKGKAL